MNFKPNISVHIYNMYYVLLHVNRFCSRKNQPIRITRSILTHDISPASRYNSYYMYLHE